MSLWDWIRYRRFPWYTSLGSTTCTETLEIAGRQTGKPIRVSLTRTVADGQEYFVSLGG
jgi:hypothetical protein